MQEPQCRNTDGGIEEFFFLCFSLFETTKICWVYQNGNFTPLKGPHRKLLTGPFSLNPPLANTGKMCRGKLPHGQGTVPSTNVTLELCFMIFFFFFSFKFENSQSYGDLQYHIHKYLTQSVNESGKLLTMQWKHFQFQLVVMGVTV